MKFKSIFTLLTALVSCQQIVPESNESSGRELGDTVTPVVMNCGDTNTAGGKIFKTFERVYLCLVFPNFPGGPRKVLYNPMIDKFEVLQI